MLQVTPRRLEVFVAVVDHAGFGAAAAPPTVTQPPVRAHILAPAGQGGAGPWRGAHGLGG